MWENPGMNFLKRRSRRGVAGMVSTIIMFAILFTVGTSYFVFVQAQNTGYIQNLLSATNRIDLAGAESLQVTTTLQPNGDIGFYVNNTSSQSVNMTAAYVKSTAGALLRCDGVGLPPSAGCGSTTPSLWYIVGAGEGFPDIRHRLPLHRVGH